MDKSCEAHAHGEWEDCEEVIWLCLGVEEGSSAGFEVAESDVILLYTVQ